VSIGYPTISSQCRELVVDDLRVMVEKSDESSVRGY